ncbi:hypothetical protein Leryth_009871 [Lithospermum erythrorhizon]|nr:hypothetical protein Leryth_009871 [Lithospermum erythrorhizon]
MKQASMMPTIFLILLLLSHHTTARLPPTNQGTSLKIQEEDISDLMGLEECKTKDEECLNRRMIAEAHLDYIYTQSNKTKP